jgi:integrase
MALNDAKVKAAKPKATPYKLADSGQLYLHVTTAGSRLWRMNYAFGKNKAGKPAQKTLTIGAYPIVSLGEARDARDAAKRLLLAGRDPALEKKLAADAHTTAYETTFESVARRWHAQNKPRWSVHHASDVITSLERDVFPAIGDLPIAELKPPRVLKVLEAIEKRDAIETAKRIRQRMSGVFVYAISSGMAETDPAAIVRGALKPIVRRGKQPAITDLDGIRKVVADAEATPSHIVTKLGLRILALTTVRPGELRGATWSEIEGLDLTDQTYGPHMATWRIPAVRMKGDIGRKEEAEGDHLVPLSVQAIDALTTLHTVSGAGPLMFPNTRHVRKPMSENALGYLLNRAGYHHRHVPHGFRASFSTIMNARAKRLKLYDDSDVIELMLAHVPKDKVKGAYDRAAHIERRRELAQTWADMLMEGKQGAKALLDLPYRAPAG